MRSRIMTEFWSLASAGIKTFLLGMVCGMGLCLYARPQTTALTPNPAATAAIDDVPISDAGQAFLNAWCAAHSQGGAYVR